MLDRGSPPEVHVVKLVAVLAFCVRVPNSPLSDGKSLVRRKSEAMELSRTGLYVIGIPPRGPFAISTRRSFSYDSRLHTVCTIEIIILMDV